MGIVDLPYDVTINSITEYPEARHDAEDAGASNWPANGYGVTLSLTGSGSSPTLDDGSPTMGSSDTSVLFPAAKVYQAGDTTTGNVGTNDMAIFGIAKSTGTTSVIAAKRDGGVGWEVGIDSSDRLYLTIEDSSGSTTVVSAVLPLNAWFGYGIFADRSGSAQIYINSAASGSPVSISSRSLTLDSATSLTIGSDSGLNGKFDKNVAYFELFHRSAWLNSHLQPDVALERLMRTVGAVYPSLATGTAIADVLARASIRYISKYESGAHKFYRVVDNWPPVNKLASGDVVYTPEAAATNLCTESNDFSDAVWFKARLTVTPDTAAGPDGETTADTLREDSTADDTHFTAHDFTQAAGALYVFSCVIEAINRNWAALQIWSATDGVAYGFFNLSTGVIGTIIGADGAGIKNLGNGRYRCWIKDTRTTAEAAASYVYIGENNNDYIFNGLNQDSLYVVNGQIESIQTDGPSSCIETTGASATRQADRLRYKGDDGNLNNTSRIGAISFKVKDDRVGGAGGSGSMFFDITDGGSSADRIAVYASASGVVTVLTAATAGSAGNVTGTTNVMDGSEHTIMVSWIDDALKLFVDGVQEGSTDTDVDIPNDLDRIDTGGNLNDTWFANANMYDVRFYDKQRAA